MKIITWYEVIFYTSWWNAADSRAFNSLNEAKREAENRNFNSVIRKRKKIIWGKTEKIKCK